jgi:beta-galactosidase
MGAEIKRIGEQFLAPASRRTWPCCSPTIAFCLQIQANNPEFKYPVHFYQVYRAYHNEHVAIDVVSPGDDLSDYRLVIVPALHVLSAETVESLTRFVEGGGTVIIGARSGVKNEVNAVVNMRLPGLLAKLCGTVVEDYDSPAPGTTQPLTFTTPELSSATGYTFAWCDILAPERAEVVARYTTGYYAGRPAITVNHVGQGHVVYVGTIGDENLHRSLAKWALGLAGIQPILETTADVEITERVQGNRRFYSS